MYDVIQTLRLPNRARRRIFTLVELLVVVAIIAILAALLFPALRKAVDMSAAASCLSNEHQLSLAVASYCNDNNNYFPAWTFTNTTKHRTWMWYLIDGGYMPPEGKKYPSDTRVCPALAGREPAGGNGCAISHYSMSMYLSGYHNGSVWTPNAVPLQKIATPASAYFLLDTTCYVKESTVASYQNTVHGSGFTWDYYSSPAALGADQRLTGFTIYSNWQLVKYRHMGGANWLFVDGHGLFIAYPWVDTTPGSSGAPTYEKEMTM